MSMNDVVVVETVVVVVRPVVDGDKAVVDVEKAVVVLVAVVVVVVVFENTVAVIKVMTHAFGSAIAYNSKSCFSRHSVLRFTFDVSALIGISQPVCRRGTSMLQIFSRCPAKS